MFSGLRQNSIFYVLDKANVPTLKVGQVVSVSNPQTKYGQYVPGQAFGQNVETVVDVSVKVGDEMLDFKQLPSNLSIANFGTNGIVVADNKEAMNAEVEGMLHSSKQHIESIPYHENVVSACDIILRELNPQFAKEKAQEEKIVTLEHKIGGVENALTDIKDMLSKALITTKNNYNNDSNRSK